jgi:hypothetical protein
VSVMTDLYHNMGKHVVKAIISSKFVIAIYVTTPVVTFSWTS